MVVRNYIGCDISKDNLDFFDSSSGRHSRVANEAAAIAAHIEGLHRGRDFVVMEATGLHDRLLRHALAAAGIGFSRLNPRHVHHHGKGPRPTGRTPFCWPGMDACTSRRPIRRRTRTANVYRSLFAAASSWWMPGQTTGSS
jgi:hypothetical protein